VVENGKINKALETIELFTKGLLSLVSFFGAPGLSLKSFPSSLMSQE
jgi:hypothetical protein